MHRKKKKTVLRAVFMYLLLSGGSWMFIYSYANSCNHMRGEYMVPAQMVVEDERATVDILGHSAEFSISDIAPHSKLYCGAYLLSPDDLRLAAYVVSLCI
ncbi:hypothetical protein [Ruminococcus flavefaciens]|uniref:hypothetical protein n=1 Tax=Ruminococcus flavefaciens TaxID=1265 RepID=UPI0013DBFD7D|nr:hypothetical protein [Ruminococcus flavefaciens]MBQ6170198.1 hypothetical protein [Ruminococcus sp.]